MTTPEPTVVRLHDRDIAFRRTRGSGPLLLLIHGIGTSSASWDPVIPELSARGADLLVVDLPGHGASAKGRGDYSLGAMASVLRDLLDHLGESAAVVVGHSLGGGIAMQFVYQFPERALGLVLVSSGGLGPEAFVPLRAATLPGAELVIPLIAHPRAVAMATGLGRLLSRARLRPEMLSESAIATVASLDDPAARAAFLATLRGVVDIAGQRVSACGKLPSTRLPVLIVWGDRDGVLPLAHGRAAVDLVERGRFVVFPGAGHEPHRHDPARFAALLVEHSVTVG